ncbi:SoxR reducing system RseC family protein [Marinobacter salicampi]|uniref:SoxR reducing system RseC family protein n=1 Tax=Marinobacter salicampi TaxID=435907 RepID=UPI00140B448C|nr:SoxR reducing system RseC family protein [Marinobacter salicampi]
MITERGRIVALKGRQAWVQTIRESACQSCSARAACGQKVLASVSSGRANQVLVSNTVGAEVGDEVTLAIAETALLKASLLVYALPLLLLVIGALAGQMMFPGSEAPAIIGAVLGLGLGFWSAHALQHRQGADWRPKLLNICSGAEATTNH